MRYLSGMAMLLACLVSIGCSPSPSQRLIGKWKYDAMDAATKNSRPDSVKSKMLGFAESMGVKMEMELEFHHDHTVTMAATMLLTGSSGPWKWDVADAKGDEATINISDADDRVVSTSIVTFLDDDRIQFTSLGNLNSCVFTRVQEP